MIDSVAGEHAVLISHYGGHTHVAGSRALEEAGMPADGKNASGLLRDSEAAPILHKVKEALESREYIKRALLEGCRKLTSFGITAVHACDVPSYGLPEHASLLHELHGERRLPLRVISYHDELPNLDFSSGMGDRFVCYGGLKLFLDGTLGGWTAAMREDFSDKPGERGELLHTDEELSGLLFEASRRGIQVQMHMIGDAATDQAVRVTRKLYERLGSRPGLPLRFNHVIVCPPGQLEELASLGVVVDVQPIQAHTDRFMAPLRLGSRRLGHSYSFRRLYDSGLLMTGSSDAPIEDPNPWLGIWSAVCRTDADGAPLKGFNPSETLTLDEALTIYTANPYKAIGWGDFGVIERGARADFVILAGDPFKGKPSDLRNVRVRSTYMDGVRMYG
jgi:predicted amidohydrolase YtcJ